MDMFIISIVVKASQVQTNATYFKSIVPQLNYKKKECKNSIYLPCTLIQETTIQCAPQNKGLNKVRREDMGFGIKGIQCRRKKMEFQHNDKDFLSSTTIQEIQIEQIVQIRPGQKSPGEISSKKMKQNGKEVLLC